MTDDGQRQAAQQMFQRVLTNMGSVIRGKDQALRHLLAAFFTGHHVLLEDVPGTGKTTMAKALAASVQCAFQRIQFTPDLLPSDIIGVTIYNPHNHEFSFHRGPIFSQVLLTDEINRASPRTQSALLEAMAEGQVSVDGQRYPLGDIFFVIATQNPVESHGTYPLPEAQMDRFGARFSLGYVAPEVEVQMLEAQQGAHPLSLLHPCIGAEDILNLRQAIRAMHVSADIKRYIVDITAATRHRPGVKIGASFRATHTLMQMSQALALFAGADFVAPEQVQEIAPAVLAHRLSLDPQSRYSGISDLGVVQDVLRAVDPPV